MYYSQHNQDRWLEENVFHGLKRGVFVDVGAHDGKTLNNTLFFEETHQWTGVNIEPIPFVFEQLEKNRPLGKNINVAIAEKEGDFPFLLNDGYTEMLSGLQEYFDERHKSRISRENAHFKGNTTITNIPCRRLDNLLREHSISRIHYLSVDVEGAEFSVIKSIDFEKTQIDVIGFENNYNDVSVPIILYLMEKGYKRLNYVGLDIMMIHKDSPLYH